MTKIYYVRHGQTNYNKKTLWAGVTNTRLTTEGIEQAKKTAKELKGVKFDAAYVSPLKRARDTFGFINKYHGLTPTIDIRVRERDFGDLEGKTAVEENSLVKRVDLYNFNKNSSFGYKVEKILDVDKRVRNFIESVAKKHKNETILVVAHGAIARHFNVYFNGMPKDGIIAKGPKNAEILIFNKK
jgi:broad specificity phosphatase PhoE